MSISSNAPLLLNQLPVSVEFTTNPKELQETLSLLYKQIAAAVNSKEGASYVLFEQGNFDQYFAYLPASTTPSPNVFRPVYRKVFDMVVMNGGPILAGSTASFAHGIAGITQTTRIYGSATNSDAPVKYLPLPYASATLVTSQIQIYLTPTNVVLVNGSTQTSLTKATIVAEYLKT